MARFYIGRRAGSAPNAKLTPDQRSANLWAQDFPGTVGQDGRVLAIGSWTGVADGGGAVTKRWAVYRRGAKPSQLLGATDTVSVSTAYQALGGGANLGGPIDPDSISDADLLSDSGHLIVRAADVVALADQDVVSGSRRSAVGKNGKPTKAMREHFRAIGLAALPSPMQPTLSVNTEDFLNIWAEVEANRRPVATFDVGINPIGTAPDSPGVVGRTDPSLTVRFADADRTEGYDDYPSRLILSVRRWTGTGWLLEATIPYLVGQTANGFAKPAAGTGAVDITVQLPPGTLTMGDTYRVHAQWEDELGAASDAYTAASTAFPAIAELIVLPGGGIEDGFPEGRIIDLTPDSLGGTYYNEDGYSSATIAVRLQRRTPGGVWQDVATSPAIARVVAPDAELAITWAESTFPTLLASQDYAVEFQVVDSNATIGPWYGRSLFHTNYRPLAPTGLSPSGSVTSAPTVTFTLTDPDDLPVSQGGTLEAELQITGPHAMNGTLDVDAAGWNAIADAANVTATQGRTTMNPRSGAGAYHHSISASTQASTVLDLVSSNFDGQPAVAGHTYTMRAWVRQDGANLRGLIGLAFYDSGGTIIGTATYSTPVATQATYFQVEAIATAPANTATVRYLLATRQTATSTTGAVRFDDVTVMPGVRYLLPATKRAGANNLWDVVTSLATHLSVAGQYTLQARGDDGDLVGDWSLPGSLIVVVGPSVSIESPIADEEVTTHTPTITWEVIGAQTRYRVRIFDDDGTTVQHDSGWQISAPTRTYTVPSGALGADDFALAEVQVDNGSAIGFAPRVPFRVLYPLPAPPTDLSLSYATLPGDDAGSVIELTWEPVDTAADNLVAMEVWRMTNSDSTSLIRVARFEAFDPGSWIDFFPESNAQHRYQVRQIAIQGTDERAGEWAVVDALLLLTAGILAEADSPESERLVLQWWSDRDSTYTRDQAWHQPAGGTDYVVVAGTHHGVDMNITWRIADSWVYGGSSGVSAIEWRNRAQRMAERDRVLHWRDGTGFSMYCQFNGDPSIRESNEGRVQFEAQISLRRIAYDPVPV